MKTVIKLIVIGAFLFFTHVVKAQPWMENIKSEKPTFQEIQKSFNDYWKGEQIERGKGYKQFKRWEWYWEPRILPNGEFPSSSVTWNEYQKYLETDPEIANRNSMGSGTKVGD